MGNRRSNHLLPTCYLTRSHLLDYNPRYMNPDQMTDTEDARHSLFKKLASEVSDRRVLDAMRRVPRERFVTAATADLAYQDIALPIAAGQTISQPTIVAIMVSELELRRSDKVLEVGSGSGYQAAILAELAREVITLERIPELAETAAEHVGRPQVSKRKSGNSWPSSRTRRGRAIQRHSGGRRISSHPSSAAEPTGNWRKDDRAGRQPR